MCSCSLPTFRTDRFLTHSFNWSLVMAEMLSASINPAVRKMVKSESSIDERYEMGVKLRSGSLFFSIICFSLAHEDDRTG